MTHMSGRMGQLNRIIASMEATRRLIACGHMRRMAAARARKLSAERRSEIASIAASARWYGQYERQACPLCGSLRTHANGHSRHGKPRGRCRECRCTFYWPVMQGSSGR